MQNILKLFVLGLLLTFMAACVSTPDYPAEPIIGFISLSKDVVDVGNSFTDSLTVTISFTDGDGNLGGNQDINSTCSEQAVCEYESDTSCFNDPAFDFFAIDLRDSCYQFVTLPDIEPDGNVKAVSGEFEVTINVGCKCSGANCPDEKTAFQIVIRDRANNFSNVITTDSVRVICN